MRRDWKENEVKGKGSSERGDMREETKEGERSRGRESGNKKRRDEA